MSDLASHYKSTTRVGLLMVIRIEIGHRRTRPRGGCRTISTEVLDSEFLRSGWGLAARHPLARPRRVRPQRPAAPDHVRRRLSPDGRLRQTGGAPATDPSRGSRRRGAGRVRGCLPPHLTTFDAVYRRM